MKKKILSFVLAFVFVLAGGFVFSACGDDGITLEEAGKLIAQAAHTFYDAHRSTEDYSAITYHFVENETSKQNETLEYKATAEAEQTTTGTFEHKFVTTKETTLAIKKEGEHLVAQMDIVNTEVETGNAVHEQNETLVAVNNTTVTTISYRLFHYMNGETQNNILLYTKSQTLNGQNVANETQKMYSSKSNMNDYDSFVESNLIKYTNLFMKYNFFSFSGEIMMVYDSLVSVEKDGNQVKINFGYTTNQIDSDDWQVVDVVSNQQAYFKDGKVWKTDSNIKQTSENFSMEVSTTFDYTETAIVDTTLPEDLAEAGYGEFTWLFGDYFAEDLSDLTDIGGLFS